MGIALADITDANILIYDENRTGIVALLAELSLSNEQIYIESDAPKFRETFFSAQPAVVVTCIDPVSLHGIDIINWVTQQNEPIAVIAVAESSSAMLSATAVRSGATDYLNLNQADIAQRLGQSIQRSLHLIDEQQVKDNSHPLHDESHGEFIGNSQAMLEVYKLAINAAKSDASVFITGENGTGKEVCAQLIHRYSKRSQAELVTLNCAAIPRGLAESEIFGHVKGSFTGAVSDRIGVGKQADQGTLFLDEIGEMEMEIQSKLLRFVQTGVFNKVGSSQSESVDVRFICATNRDPHQQIADGTFRQDLFYRLNVVHIHLPPLRDRGKDILALAKRFLTQFSQEENKHFAQFSAETAELLLSYSWPGNIRELQNVIRNIVVLHNGQTVIPSMLPLAIIREKGDRRRNGSVDSERQQMLEKLRESVNQLNTNQSDSPRNTHPATMNAGSVANAQVSHQTATAPLVSDSIRPLDDVINECIQHAIEACNGNVASAAHKLGISTSTLYRKIKHNSHK